MRKAPALEILELTKKINWEKVEIYISLNAKEGQTQYLRDFLYCAKEFSKQVKQEEIQLIDLLNSLEQADSLIKNSAFVSKENAVKLRREAIHCIDFVYKALSKNIEKELNK